MLWSATARRLLAANRFGEAQMAMVALYLCLKHAHLLVSGKPPRILGDEKALADAAPYDADELRALRDRIGGFRDEILHLTDKEQVGRAVTVAWTTGPPYFAVRSSIGQRGQLEWDDMTRAEMIEILDTLDPWLHRQWERQIDDERDPEKAQALAEKVDRTMRALGGS
jgi:hypothetical protein